MEITLIVWQTVEDNQISDQSEPQLKSNIVWGFGSDLTHFQRQTNRQTVCSHITWHLLIEPKQLHRIYWSQSVLVNIFHHPTQVIIWSSYNLLISPNKTIEPNNYRVIVKSTRQNKNVRKWAKTWYNINTRIDPSLETCALIVAFKSI